MITGDNQKTARAIGDALSIDEIYSDVKPVEKESVVLSLKKQGKVIMVGDGINDAPALTSADIGSYWSYINLEAIPVEESELTK